MDEQHRGGRGVAGTRLREDDTVEEVVPAMDHDTVLFFTADGVVRSRRAWQLPEASRTASGAPLTAVRAQDCLYSVTVFAESSLMQGLSG